MEEVSEFRGRYVYLCEDSTEGIFTAVYDAFAEGHRKEDTALCLKESTYTTELFTTYIPVETDMEKAAKVARTMQKKVSWQVYDALQMASLSYMPKKADTIYRVIILALQMGNQVLDHLTDPNVALLFKMEINANNEILHEQGFLRFEELASGVLFARINPKNAILPYLAYHFADRFPEENWVIADTTHGSMMIHERGKGCSYIHAKDEDFDRLLLSYSEEEEVFQKLWKRYIDSVGIKARENISLQNQMLPLRFRKYMKEF